MSDRLAMVDLSAMHTDIRAEIMEAIERVLESGAFVGGPEVAAFEADFARYTGARHAIGVANGTDAIELSLRALDLPAGSGVVVPANTFIATAEGVVAAGLRPVFVDVEPGSGLLDLEAVERLAPEVSAIVAVHLYGRIADMDATLRIADAHGCKVVEDAAQAHGARRGGRHAGTFADTGCFSFYPGKNLGAIGDGGAVLTDSDEVADRVRLLRDHGRRGRDTHELVGRNSRLDGLQAAVLAVKLGHLDEWTAARRRIAEHYRANLDPQLLDRAATDDPGAESHHLFPVLVEDRDGLAESLSQQGISTGVHYRVPVPETEAFGRHVGDFPVAAQRARLQLSLPIHPYLSLDAADRVAAGVNAGAGVPS
jgi:dTDP-4-amino-4,6-dideoxygalactose transaminase